MHNRKNIRLKDYDYSQEGLYFVTICIQDRKCILGNVHNGKIEMNEAGMMIEKWLNKLERKFTNIKCEDRVIMPNHIHCIIRNSGNVLQSDVDTGSPLNAVIQWFKTMTTNEYIKGVKKMIFPSYEKRLWQRNYWEHIIRDEKSYRNTVEYIRNNPIKWTLDELNPLC